MYDNIDFKKLRYDLKIYYGSAGTGKTTKAQKETAGRCMICNNSMLPADLMEDFIFIRIAYFIICSLVQFSLCQSIFADYVLNIPAVWSVQLLYVLL